MSKLNPDLKGIRYDFGRRLFVGVSTGQPIGPAPFKLLRNTTGAREARAGSATLKRAVLVHSLRQEAGREGWDGVLEGLARQRNSLELARLRSPAQVQHQRKRFSAVVNRLRRLAPSAIQ